ncbi:hypothetical protein CMV30_11040 [Nibricoccus aquaticus]|uniref:Tat pathway signal protein n=1 Tax=Nibricoccus aquaticus TaxID=2576891 RepID=A0A290Q6Y9_9BACT|nr:DUF1501 domain-containing protein [Nibricoccus aquaticus]ATC64445.1 hypothetical protein CMV30_11040 [Nibricoccus aquaticus]
MSQPINRRAFLGQASCAAVGSTSILSTLLNLRMASSAAAQSMPAAPNTDDYRALVCLFFAGGQDSYNMLMPCGTEHAAYVTTRGGLHDDAANPGGLALSQSEILSLGNSGMLLGLHPSMTGLRDLYTQGKLAMVANVGTLNERITKTQYNSSGAKLPRGLYSHSDQQQQWHTSVSTETRGIGWAGLAADLLHSTSNDQRISMNTSLSGNNVWQSGNTLFPYSVSSSGAVALSDYNNSNASNLGDTNRTSTRTAAVNSLLGQQYQNLLESTFSSNMRDSIDTGLFFSASVNSIVLTTLFPGDTGYTGTPAGYTLANDPARSLAAQLKMVVRSVAARAALGLRRQTFFVSYGGWDHHDEVIDAQARMLDVVSRCLTCFYAALEEVGSQNQVTLFTASDFGRTLTSNGNGSDHAWGGNHFVLGGAVNGGLVYGAYPDLTLTGPSIVTSRGVTLPALSVDEYFADMALWLGVPPGSLSSVLPRIGNFYTPSGTRPVGFMKP